jgi:hypothetical protein
MAQAGLTQALSIAAFGIVMLAFDTLVLGQIVDLFVYYASTWELQNDFMRALMQQIMVFATWFYTIIFIMAWLFMAYPVIYIIKRHRYMDVEDVSQTEEMYMGGGG